MTHDETLIRAALMMRDDILTLLIATGIAGDAPDDPLSNVIRAIDVDDVLARLPPAPDPEARLAEAITPAPQPEVATLTAQEAVLREIIDWCHLQHGNYPNWMDRARQAVGDFEGDPGPPPQPSETVAAVAIAALAECIGDMEAAGLNSPARAHAALRALKGDDANG